MLQRSLLRQGRQLQSHVQSRPISHYLHQARNVPLPLLIKAQIAPATRLPRRWVSTDAEEKTLGQDGATGSTSANTSQEGAQEAARQQSKDSDTERTNQSPKGDDNAPQKELEAKNREIIDLKDKYLRSVAEFRNLQDRTRRDIDTARNFAIQRFASDLLESIDNLDRALSTVPADSLKPTSDNSNQDLLNLHGGLKMSESILMSTLKKHGLERFDPMEGEGRKFDPKVDEAVFMSPMPGKENGDVMHTQSKGYMLNGRVLRAAKVGVVKNVE